jgi:hypothetical protein
MPKRPRNRCQECGYGWYPRGNDRSRKCPNCGVLFTHREREDGDPDGAPPGGSGKTLALVALGLGLLVVGGACAGLLVVFGDRQPAAKEGDKPAAGNVAAPPEAPKPAPPEPRPAPKVREGLDALLDDFRADAASARRKHKGRSVVVAGWVISAEWTDPSARGPSALLEVGGRKNLVAATFSPAQRDDVLALKPGQPAQVRGEVVGGDSPDGVLTLSLGNCELISPLASAQAKLAPLPAPAASPESAPAPRRVYNATPDGRPTEWARCGAVEVRLLGARVARPLILDARGGELSAPDPVLLIWVEARRVRAGQTSLNRWVGSLNSAATLRQDGKPLPPVRYPGYGLPEQLQHVVKLGPGDPPAVDVLAFREPDPAVTGVTLRLAAAHVGEAGEFYFDLPRSMWKSAAPGEK